MIGIQAVVAMPAHSIEQNEVKSRPQEQQLTSVQTHKKSKSHKKRKHSKNKVPTPIKEVIQTPAQKESSPPRTSESQQKLKHTEPKCAAEATETNHIKSKSHTHIKQPNEKTVYVRKNPLPEQQTSPKEALAGKQKSCQHILSQQDEVKLPENHARLSSSIEKLRGEPQVTLKSKVKPTGVIKCPTKLEKIEAQNNQQMSPRLDAKLEDRLSAESRKQSESITEITSNIESIPVVPSMKEKQSQQPSKEGGKFKENVFYTPQKKTKKKQDIQSFYYHQLSKKTGFNSHYEQTDEDVIVNRNFTQSPGFTRQRENEEDVKQRRQEDRLHMLMQILEPKNVNVHAYLDMGCGNCEISAEIGKVYGANHIIGCDIYSEDQFVRPAETPSSTLFTYIANRNDSLKPLEDKSLDLITCFMVLHHIENLDKNIRELQRVLRDGGFLYIREHDVPEDNKELDQYLRFKHERFDDCGQFMKFWGKNQLMQKLSRFGFVHVGDSLYSDNRPNRQKVYHSLFQFSIELSNIMEEMYSTSNDLLPFKEVEKSENVHPILPKPAHQSNSSKKKAKTHAHNAHHGGAETKSKSTENEIKISGFEIDGEEILELKNLKKEVSTESERQQNGKQLHNQQSTSITNLQPTILSKNLSTPSTSVGSNTTVASSSEEINCSKTNPYSTDFDEIKENNFLKNRKQSPLIWRNNSKKESSQDHSNENNHNYNNRYSNNIKNNLHYNNTNQREHHNNHSHNHNNHHHAHHTHPANYNNIFSAYTNSDKEQVDHQGKFSKNPNYRYKNNKSDFQFTYKKHKNSQDYEFEDDDTVNAAALRRKKDSCKLVNNPVCSATTTQKKQNNNSLKQAKAVQLIDILS